MKQVIGNVSKGVLACLLMALLAACSDPYASKYASLEPYVAQQFDTLRDDLSNNRIRNAMLLTQYTQILSAANPELKPLLNTLAQDATSSGPVYTGLQRRFEEVKANPMKLTVQEQYTELLTIKQALEPDVYNDMLSDTVNVVADLSNGKFERVSSISKAAEQRANPSAKDYGAGSQLIGNPSYGQWTTGSNGLSFWEWYGMYALFSDLVGGRRHYYNDWSYRRGYSYYNDYGRNLYTSKSELRQQDRLYKRTANKFAKSGKRFDSPYSKTRTGSSKLSNKSYVAASSNKFSNKRTVSSFAKPSGSSNSGKFSKQSGSLRSGSYRTSGGLFGGK